MRTLTAIALICLSVPTFASELDHGVPYAATIYWSDAGADYSFDDENTATIFTPARPMSEDQSLEGIETGNPYARTDFDFGFENTGTISPSVEPTSEEFLLDLGLITDEALAYTRDGVSQDVPGDTF